MDETRFLSWHRAYLLQFENWLREASGKNITIPYFDCASDASVESNDLFHKLNQRPFSSAYIGLEGRYTSRSPGAEYMTLYACRSRAKGTFKRSFYSTLDFQEHLRKGIHNFLHMWVGNDMSDLSYASFDPVFWFHHANIDRLWVKWQRGDGKAVQDREFSNNEDFLNWDFSQRGFSGLAYKDFMNSRSLPSLGGNQRVRVVYEDESRVFTTSKRSVEEEEIGRDVDMIIKNLAPTENSFLIRATYQSGEREVELGTFTVLGYGNCCKNGICSNLAKKHQTFDDGIDVSHIAEDLVKRQEISVTLHVYNLSKKTQSSLEELQNIIKNTVAEVPELELQWETKTRSHKFPKITISNKKN